MTRFVAHDLTERVQNCRLSLRDEYGPEVAIGLFDSKTGNFCGGFVGHNTSLCPPDERIWNGGIRDVTNPEWLALSPQDQLDRLSWYLARPMTLKHHWCYSRNSRPPAPLWGGGKAMMVRNKWEGTREDFIRHWTEAMTYYRLADGRRILGESFIGGADAGLTEEDLALICETNGSTHCVTGGPGQLQYEKDGVTGLILLHAAHCLTSHLRIPWKDARIGIHGFGNVGKGVAQHLARPEYTGAKIVAASNRSKPGESGIASLIGMGPELILWAAQNGERGISTLANERHLSPEGRPGYIVPLNPGAALEGWQGLSMDVLILAAPIENIITDGLERGPRVKIVLSGTNSGITGTAYGRLHERGIIAPSDFMVNMGAASMAKSSWHGFTREQCFDLAIRAIEANLGWAIYESESRRKCIHSVIMEETLAALAAAKH